MGGMMAQVHPTEETLRDENPRWFTPGVRGIGLTTFLADVGHEVPTALFASLVMVNLGALGGSLAALLFLQLVGVRLASLRSVIPVVLAALAILCAVRQLPRVTSRERTQLRITMRPLLRGPLGQVLIGVSLFGA